jgi:release factor glutamine methyltransferase
MDATVADALSHARALGVARLDAQLLVGHVLRRARPWLLANADARLAPADAEAVRCLIARRAAGEPLAYLVGEREFHGLSLLVTAAVLVPRADTETLVDWALELLAGPLATIDAPRVLDLGTGSGAIALAVKHACPRAEVHASDDSSAALGVARANGLRLGLDVSWHAGSWWDAVVAEAPFDLVLANPPYIAKGDRHLAALRHEPPSALVPLGDRGDGLADIERIVAGGAGRVRAGGWLLLEHGFNQADAVRRCLGHEGWVGARTRQDLANQDRASGARREH